MLVSGMDARYIVAKGNSDEGRARGRINRIKYSTHIKQVQGSKPSMT